ncbi:DNA-processing protein DprA [Prevotella sp. E9-3]|uniref:DNA-processing protein DprA n=1 Tax=Prevotella sp. E9-3 TaxID=2913621 RepID=UPI001ED9F6E1|nr:DNA-processing protein DprA [Prevotella sp. E9-3]UKK48518.1 DNA-processing protein DprA [Prevotella sp. E9-3]
MNEQEVYYTIALTRLTGFNFQTALQLYRELGGGQAVYEHRNDIKEVMPDCSDRLAENLKDWSLPLARAAQEMEFIIKHRIRPLLLGDERYPQRLCECEDAPIILYYLGSAELNQKRVINIIGTRHITPYGQDLIRHLVSDLKQMGVQPLVVSGLAYGVDICAHREALEQGMETVGVLAHGLDDLYPARHRDTAKQMVTHGGLLTEYMSETRADKINFVRRNRIVAGMSDATILVESASKGGGLITCGIAQDYNRSVFAFPGAVGAPYSEGCNQLIRNNGAQLITSAADMIEAMGWQTDLQLRQAKQAGIERSLFPDLTAEEQQVVDVLSKTGDLQLNMLSVKSNIPIGQLTALLFSLEMKGVVKPLAGGNYHMLY